MIRAGLIPVRDVAADMYYRNVPGFRCEYVDGDRTEFAIDSRGSAALTFRRAPGSRP